MENRRVVMLVNCSSSRDSSVLEKAVFAFPSGKLTLSHQQKALDFGLWWRHFFPLFEPLQFKQGECVPVVCFLLHYSVESEILDIPLSVEV